MRSSQDKWSDTIKKISMHLNETKKEQQLNSPQNELKIPFYSLKFIAIYFGWFKNLFYLFADKTRAKVGENVKLKENCYKMSCNKSALIFRHCLAYKAFAVLLSGVRDSFFGSPFVRKVAVVWRKRFKIP